MARRLGAHTVLPEKSSLVPSIVRELKTVATYQGVWLQWAPALMGT